MKIGDKITITDVVGLNGKIFEIRDIGDHEQVRISVDGYVRWLHKSQYKLYSNPTMNRIIESNHLLTESELDTYFTEGWRFNTVIVMYSERKSEVTYSHYFLKIV
jgi:hypothetical protein